MTPPIELHHIPPRPRIKPATKRAFCIWVLVVTLVIGCAGLIARCTTPVFPL